MLNMINHSYHLVDDSPWPIISAIGAFYTTTGMASWFQFNQMNLFMTGLIIILLVMTQWWRDVSCEGAFQGLHSSVVELGLRWAMILFIISEIFFFLSFFWAFFHSSLAPAIQTGNDWPPMWIVTFNPFKVPLLNTVILLASGVTVTWAHHALMCKQNSQTLSGLALTIILGVYFTLIQAMEYFEASFTMADSIYGSTFFIATGFHGLHVIIGTSFLLVCLLRHMMYHFSPTHHFGLEAAAWYWHFVDVVWLFLYSMIYWWSSV